MTYLLPATLDGSVTVQAHGEYTSNYVAQAFDQQLEPFVELLQLGTFGDTPTADDIKLQILTEPSTAADRFGARIKTALEALIGMAKNGVLEDPANPTTSPKDRLNIEMVASLNELIKSVRAAGGLINMSTGVVTFTDNDAVNWKNLAVNSEAILQIMTTANAQISQNRTLQALVELIYVKTGNDLLTENLERLETALSTTKDSLRTLSQLQDIHNKIQTSKQILSLESFAAINYNPSNPTGFMQGISGAFPGIAEQASRNFLELEPTVDFDKLTNADTTLFLELRNQLIQQISQLTITTPLDENGSDEGTLLDSLRTVKNTMDAAIDAANDSRFPASALSDTDRAKVAMRLWILDNQRSNDQDKISDLSSGQIQRDLTTAIAAGQSLNDTQKEEVRRYLFVFEEYYKSAAAILNKITQLVERMAQGIAR